MEVVSELIRGYELTQHEKEEVIIPCRDGGRFRARLIPDTTDLYIMS